MSIKHIALSLLALTTSLHAVSIDAVYFAQTHVQKAGDAYPTLVSSRDALIKVHVTDPGAVAAPAVTATFSNGGSITLTGPATLPTSIPDGPGVVQHDAANTFTGIIPAAKVQPGLTITVTAGAATTNITNLDIGAPSVLIMTSANVHYFEYNKKDYSAGWAEEMEAKLPVSSFVVNETPDVVFSELVIPARAGAPAIRASSEADYEAQSGVSFDGENIAATAWNVALRRAAGRGPGGYANGMSLYHLFKYTPNNEGVGGGFSCVSTRSPGATGVMWHELGHALSLPHWGEVVQSDPDGYPYKGTMYGINPPVPIIYNDVHVGPTWAYDLPSQTFLNCTLSGVYKNDPMQGGGVKSPEPGFIFNHFSDFSANRIRDILESTIVVWNDTLSSYAKWNDTTKDYTTLVASNGVNYPLQRDQSVISIIAAVSGATPEASMVYPPIGPYTAGLIQLFDPSNPSDRADAISKGFAPTGGCDATLRVTQGPTTSDYMIAASYDEAGDPLSTSSLFTEGINLPAINGTVTRVELLLTPDAEINGLPADPTVLYSWSTAAAPGSGTASFAVAPTAEGPFSITMTATTETPDSDFNRDVEYRFIENSGNSGGSSSDWQTSPVYTDTNLQAETQYRYQVQVRSAISKAESNLSPELAATTDASTATFTVMTANNAASDDWTEDTWSAGFPDGDIDAILAAGVHATSSVPVPAWSGTLTLNSGSSLRVTRQPGDVGGVDALNNATHIILDNATIYDDFITEVTFPTIQIANGSSFHCDEGGAARWYRKFSGEISGTGGFTTRSKDRMTYQYNTFNSYTGGLTIDADNRHVVELNAAGAAGQGDVTVNPVSASNAQSAVLVLGANDVFNENATLTLNGSGWNGSFSTGHNPTNLYSTSVTRINMNSNNATVAKLILDGVEQPIGTYTGPDGTWIRGSGILTVTGETVNDYAAWIAVFPSAAGQTGFAEDADDDGISNGVESYFGTNPTAHSASVVFANKAASQFTFTHPINSTPVSGLSASYEWSSNLLDFHGEMEDDGNGTVVSFSTSDPVDDEVLVTATLVSGTAPEKMFFRLVVEQTP